MTKARQLQRNPIIQFMFFSLITVLELMALELFFSMYPSDLLSLDIGIIIKNIALAAAINLLLASLLANARRGLLLSVSFFALVGIINYFVIAFRGYGVVFMDFYAIRTAATVAGQYDYTITASLAWGLLAESLLICLCFLLPPKRQENRQRKPKDASWQIPYTSQEAYRKGKKHTLRRCIAGTAISLLFFAWINIDTAFFNGISGLTWDHSIGMRDYGYLLYFTANAGKATVREPAGYSVEKVDGLLSKYAKEYDTEANTAEASTDSTGTTKNPASQNPNIIIVMNESFADLQVLGEFHTSADVMPFYHSLKENTIKGYAQSSVYGGYTANSEFEALTGCTKKFLPGNPYLQYIDGYLPSLITSLKEQGYENATAVHPYNPSGYNRNRVYPLLGFDRFLSLKDFSAKELVRSYVGDRENYQKLFELYESKEKGVPLCIFNVTMQNHNPYTDADYIFENPVQVDSFPATISANQYLSLMKMSDDALKELITYFKEAEEPVAILFFGDHQPHLKDSFYQNVMGSVPDLFTDKQVMQKYLIPFFIWANYDIPEKEIERTSINYLGPMLLETAGLKLTAFQKYLLGLQKKLPSVSANGYYDQEGNLYNDKYLAEGEPAALLREYEMIQYNYLFGGKGRLSKYFHITAMADTH